MTVVDQKGKPVEEAVVWAPGVGKPKAVEKTIFQKYRQYFPEVTVISVGSTVRFPNRDTVQHHVYSFSPAKTFDIPLYIGDAPKPVKFEKAGVVTLGCNIHDWMSAYVLVLDTTAFTQTNAEGEAVLKDISKGTTLQVWHPRLRGNPVEVKAESGAKITLVLRPAVKRETRDDSTSNY